MTFASTFTLETGADAAFTSGGTPGPQNPLGAMLNPVAGLVANTTTNSRQIQFALKLIFLEPVQKLAK